MIPLDSKEVWRQIPPEEKIHMMSVCHAKGAQAAFVSIIVGCTLAVSLKIPWLVWGSLILSPLLFQFAAGREWRNVKPRIMLEYLAVRSASRRFAFSINSKDLTLAMTFRGQLEELFDDDRLEESLEAEVEKGKTARVWISLFNDSVIMMSERDGGGDLKLGHVLNERLKIEPHIPDGEPEYSNNHAIVFSFPNRKDRLIKFKLTSHLPGALLVFEKKILSLQKQNIQKLKEEEEALGRPSTRDEDDFNVGNWEEQANQ